MECSDADIAVKKIISIFGLPQNAFYAELILIVTQDALLEITFLRSLTKTVFTLQPGIYYW